MVDHSSTRVTSRDSPSSRWNPGNTTSSTSTISTNNTTSTTSTIGTNRANRPSGQQILTLPNGLTGPSSIVSTSSSTGAALPQGSNLIAPNKAYFLTVRNNGLTEYNTMNIPVWSKPALSANAPYTLLLLIDGTLQLVGANNTVAWSSGVPSSGTAPFQLSLDNTGNLSVMDSTGLLVWSNCVDTSNLPAGFTCPATR